MTTQEVDYYFCRPGVPHSWDYRGRKAQAYRCRSCGEVVTKTALKGATDVP